MVPFSVSGFIRMFILYKKYDFYAPNLKNIFNHTKHNDDIFMGIVFPKRLKLENEPLLNPDDIRRFNLWSKVHWAAMILFSIGVVGLVLMISIKQFS